MRKTLKKLRIDNGYTVGKFAKTIGISKPYYYKIESGERNPNIKLAKKLEIVLNTPMEILFPDIFEGIE